MKNLDYLEKEINDFEDKQFENQDEQDHDNFYDEQDIIREDMNRLAYSLFNGDSYEGYDEWMYNGGDLSILKEMNGY